MKNEGQTQEAEPPINPRDIIYKPCFAAMHPNYPELLAYGDTPTAAYETLLLIIETLREKPED